MCEKNAVLGNFPLQATHVHSGRPGKNIHPNTIEAHSQAPMSPETPETLPGSRAKRQTSEAGIIF